MKSFLVCVAIGSLFAVSAVSNSCHAEPMRLTKSEVSYCEQWADAQYGFALDADTGLPDAAYEGAEEQCEVQWLTLAVQWDDPVRLDELAVLGLAAGTAEGMSYADAMARAAKFGSLGVEKVGPALWAPISAEADCQPLPGEEKGAH